MKNKKNILRRISLKRFRKRLKSKISKQKKKRENHLKYLTTKSEFKSEVNYNTLLEKYLPTNLKFLITCESSDFYLPKLNTTKKELSGVFEVPKEFSLIDFPKESFKFIKELLSALILQRNKEIVLDYQYCKRLDLGAQVFLDIIIRDVLNFYKRVQQIKPNLIVVKSISGKNINDVDLKKLLFSVGSPAIHSNKSINFKDIEPYKLCIHNRAKDGNKVRIMEQKDIDTTTLVEYVISSLGRLNKTLTPDKLDDLCTVIGEILINAEEHSTTNYRFSIGYFQEKFESNKNFGVFKLVIMNLGSTIYEKFIDPNCPNLEVKKKMKKLSDSYNSRNFFFKKQFEEETLWTLYALQEGVTTTDPNIYKRRGNGSIRFIESFFNIKGRETQADEISKMVILSGNTNITFDGTFDITENLVGNEKFKYMTFNESGLIEDKPDKKYVKFVDNYFPGTIISALIFFDKDDLK